MRIIGGVTITYSEFMAAWSADAGEYSDIRRAGFPALLDRTGLTAYGFAKRYGFPLRSVYCWCETGTSGRSLPPSMFCMVAYVVFFGN